MWASGAYGYLADYLWWFIVLASLLIHTRCFFKFFPADRRPRTRLVVGNVLITLCLLTLVGLCGETYLRFCSIETDAHGSSLTAKRWFKVYPVLNSLLFRDREWTERKPQGVYRVAFLGDSFTYGWGIKQAQDRFTNLLQRKFDSRGQDSVEVMNVAWAAWNTRDHLRVAGNFVDKYSVDELVLCYLPNDIEDLIPVGGEVNPREAPRSAYVNVESSFLLDFIFHRIYAKRLRSTLAYWDWLWDAYATPRIWDRQQADLVRIIEAAASRGVRLRVVLFPFLRVGGERFDSKCLDARLVAFFTSKGVEVLELLPVVETRDSSTLQVNRADPHPNEAANALFAEAIWKAFYERDQRSGSN